ncbi:MAG: hypothetical protein GY705_15790 [Bacteroidetes bacterium]|nr:hypothetical protein [Bacteroidota bacterium]
MKYLELKHIAQNLLKYLAIDTFGFGDEKVALPYLEVCFFEQVVSLLG